MLIQEIQSYKDYIGQIHIRDRFIGEPIDANISANGQLFLVQAYMLAVLNKESIDSEKDNFNLMMKSCYKDTGIYNRSSLAYIQDFNSPDNHIGMALGSQLFGTSHAHSILLNYSSKYKLSDLITEYFGSNLPWYLKLASFTLGWYNLKYVYKWNDTQLISKCWLGIQPGLIAHIKFCAGINPSLFEKICWCIGMLISASNTTLNNIDPVNLGWLCHHGAKGKSFICDIVGNYFIKKMKQLYNGLDFGKIYWSSNLNHPSSKYWKWD